MSIITLFLFQVKFCVDTFLKYCMNMYSFVMFVQICGYNRARQRDKLARLLDDFASLQDEAERVDTYLFELNPEENERRPYFSTWVLYHCLRAMAMYILSGLELELYSVHEYMYIYWYANFLKDCTHFYQIHLFFFRVER